MTPAAVDQRLFPGQTPAFAAVRIEMTLHPAADREPFGDDLEILRLEPLAERRGKDLARLAADQRALAGEPAAMGERIVDRDIARLLILDEEHGIGDAVEELDARKRTPEDRGERRRRVGFDRLARAIVRIFNPEPAFSSRIGSRDMRMSGPSECPTLGSLKMSSQVFSGTMPALMTPCGPDRRPDFDALVQDGETSCRRRNVGARLLRLDGRLAAAHDRTANGGRRAFGEGRPAGHRRHGRAEHRAGRGARRPREGERREAGS